MKKFYQIRNSAEKIEILLYDTIGKAMDGEGVTAKQFVADLKPHKGKPLTVRINSAGGNVFEGQAIHTALKNHSGSITAYIDGIAASIASVIAMAADKVVMPSNAMMMIHDPWGFTMGHAKDMRKQADALDKVKHTLVNAYHDKSRLARHTIEEMMADETWMTADEAKDNGFADIVSEPANYQANFQMLRQFSNTPNHLFTNEVQTMTPEANYSNLPLEEQCKIDWQNNTDNCREVFYDLENFIAYTKAAENGQIKGVEPKRRSQPLPQNMRSAEERCREQWQKDPELRRDFNDDLDCFIAYQKALDNGQIRVTGGAR